jgi:hypothetical protein
MALNVSHMLSTSVLRPASPAPQFGRSELIRKDAPDVPDVERDDPGRDGRLARRTQIWEFGTNLHCSIVGTCLTTASCVTSLPS